MNNNILGKVTRMPVAVKASVAFFISSLVSKGIVYLTTPIFTRLLTSTEFGQVTIYNTWCTLFGYIAMFSLSGGVFNNGMSDYPEKRDEYSFSLLGLSNIITISFSIIILCIYPLIDTIIGLDYALVVLMCASFIVRPAYQFWYTRQRYEMNYKNVLIYSMLMALFSPIVSIVAVYLTHGSRMYARIMGSEITIIVICLFFYIYLGSQSKWKLNITYWKQAFLFNLPLLPHYLSMYLLGSSDRIMISHLIGDSATAYYSVAYSITSIAIIVWSSIDGSLIPYTYEKCKIKDYGSINSVSIPILGAFAFICIAIILLGPEVVRIMATADYLEAIYVIPPVIAGCFFQVQYSLYANIVYYYKKPQYVMIGSVTAVIFNIGLNYIFIKQYGYIAAGYTTLLSYAIQAFIDYLAMKKVVRDKVYNMTIISIISLLLAIISIACSVLYDKTPIYRYLIIIIMAFTAIIMRKKILNHWRLVRK